MSAGRADSIRARLLNRAKERGEDYNLLLTRYALERWLYRLSVSKQPTRFILKGAMLFALWYDIPHRPTRDADFLGVGPADADSLKASLQAVCAIACDDGMEFRADSIVVTEIRKEANYDGLRVALTGLLGTAKCSVQMDVGFGDAVTPAPQPAEYPVLLPELPAPRLPVYPRETAIAEKLEAIISLGMRNSRMKDYFDLYLLLTGSGLDGALLAEAIANTCHRRGTALPTELPLGLDDVFGKDTAKLAQWKGFINKNRLAAPALPEVVTAIRLALEAPLQGARTHLMRAASWHRAH